jgi:hypothetical protein
MFIGTAAPLDHCIFSFKTVIFIPWCCFLILKLPRIYSEIFES